MQSLVEASPRLWARIAGVLYLITFVAGGVALASSRGRLVGDLISTTSYTGVTLLLYDLLKPVNRGLSLIAAVFIAGVNAERWKEQARAAGIETASHGRRA